MSSGRENAGIDDALHQEKGESKYLTLFREAPVGMYQNLRSGGFIEVNPAFAALFGYLCSDDLCAGIQDIDSQLYKVPGLRRELQDRLERENFVSGVEFEAYHRDGSVIWIRASARAYRNANGDVLCYHGTAENISESKANEQHLLRVRQDLEDEVRDLSSSNRELADLGRVTAHELQEPLRNVISHLNRCIQQRTTSPSLALNECVDSALQGAKRMKALIDELLAYYRLGRKAAGDSVAVSNCDDVLDLVRKNLETLIEESGAELLVTTLPRLRVAQGPLVLLFQNLIGNAIKFRAHRPPRIRICAQRYRNSWLFRVSDNGIGFEREHSERIFHLFERLHSCEEYEGTGIGLASCKKIVEDHGGRIWATSEVGVGTTVSFTFPTVN